MNSITELAAIYAQKDIPINWVPSSIRRKHYLTLAETIVRQAST